MTVPIKERPNDKDRRVFNDGSSVFFIFIPFREAVNKFVFSEAFGEQLEAMSESITKKSPSTRQFFATDPGSVGHTSFTNTKSWLAERGVEFFDITAIDGFIPCDRRRTAKKTDVDMKSLLGGRVNDVNIECVDRNKILVCSLAGENGFGDVVAMDVDLILFNDLFVKPGATRAFTYTPCHANPSVLYDMEMSMIFASENRPVFRGEDLFEWYKRRFKEEFQSSDSPNGTYGAWSHSTFAVDPLVDISHDEVASILKRRDYEEYLHALIGGLPPFKWLLDNLRLLVEKSYAHPTVFCHDPVEYLRTIIANYQNRDGDYIIHGRYHSNNKETWRAASLQEAA